MERIARQIYNGEKVKNDGRLLARTAEALSEKVSEGYGKHFNNIAYNSPDFGMLANLTRNVYQFSAAKNYNQLKDITRLLYEGEHLRSEGDFFQAVKELNLSYNKTWLATERDTAIAGGQMASKWVDIEANTDILPLLQYKTVGDDNVRADHELLDGVVKPCDDDFWATYYPPNGWRCRCGVRQLPAVGIEPTPDEQIITPSVPEYFKTNLAKTGLIFPKEHPYYIGIPPAELTRALAYLSPENAFFAVKMENGAFVDFHVLHNKGKLIENLTLANDLTSAGYTDIKLLPHLPESEKHLLKDLLPAETKTEKPDAIITNEAGRVMVTNFETAKSGADIETYLKDTAKNAEHLFIKLTDEATPPPRKRLKEAIDKNPNLKKITVIDADGGITEIID